MSPFSLNLLLISLNWNGIISLLIFSLEFLLLINLLIFTKKNRTNKIIIFILALLAGYQAFEYFICGLDFNSSITAYFAFVDISFLPPLTLLLVFTVFKFDFRSKYIFFIPAIFFSVYYLVKVEEFAVVQCTVLYATYNYPLGDLYGVLYYAPILLSFIILLLKRKTLEGKQFLILLVSFLFIILPVITGFILLYLNQPGLIQSMESLLCKFAFGYAVGLSIFNLNNKQKN